MERLIVLPERDYHALVRIVQQSPLPEAHFVRPVLRGRVMRPLTLKSILSSFFRVLGRHVRRRRRT